MASSSDANREVRRNSLIIQVLTGECAQIKMSAKKLPIQESEVSFGESSWEVEWLKSLLIHALLH